MIDLMSLWESDAWRTIRTQAWAQRTKWYTGLDPTAIEKYRKGLIIYFPVHEKIAFPEDYEKALENKLERFATWRMLQFFAVLSVLDVEDKHLRVLNFPYPAWRSYLYDVATLLLEQHDEGTFKMADCLNCTPKEISLVLPPDERIKYLKLLDKRFRLPRFSEHFVDKEPYLYWLRSDLKEDLKRRLRRYCSD